MSDDEQQQQNQYAVNPSNLISLTPPYLPDQKIPMEFTLVLDLDETLIHFIEMMHHPRTGAKNNNNDETLDIENDEANESDVGGYFLIRPGAHEFLRQMSQVYELVIFTAAMQDYADWVLDQLDTENLISYRLYRQHTTKQNHVYLKDLVNVGRPIAKTIIVDNVAANF